MTPNLLKPHQWSGPGQLKLTIRLRIKLRQLAPKIHFWQRATRDFDGKAFSTLPWTDAYWQRFIRGAAGQADMWNNKFWLSPTSAFAKPEFDWLSSNSVPIVGTIPNQVFRPNIRCELVVDFEAKDDVHRTIDVANLEFKPLGDTPLTPGTFRSHAFLYDSLDNIPWAFPWGTEPDKPTETYVIAHEIGHAIGLGHIGTLLKTPLCEAAIDAKTEGTDRDDSRTEGGRDSLYCYGWDQGIGVSGNIMGAGASFTVENAEPWLAAFTMMRGPFERIQWQAVTRDPGPGSWLRMHTNK